MSQIIQTISTLALAEALRGINPEEEPIIVAGGYDDDCDPCQLPFGGRVDGDGNPPTVGDRSAMPGTGVIHGLLSRLGAQPCRLWGADVPGQCQDANGCFTGKKVCGAIFPYSHTFLDGVTSSYSIKAKKFFWPIFWVDSSDGGILIDDLEYQGDPVFENGVGAGALRPSTMFPSDGTNFVPGLPAIDSTDGLDFTLSSDAGGGAAGTFEGMFIGISIRN